MSSKTSYVLKAGKHARTLNFPKHACSIHDKITTFFSRLTQDFYLESRLASEERSGG